MDITAAFSVKTSSDAAVAQGTTAKRGDNVKSVSTDKLVPEGLFKVLPTEFTFLAKAR